jgi:YHS domain-containing protein
VGVLAELVQFNAARKPSALAASSPQETTSDEASSSEASASTAAETPISPDPGPGDSPADAIDPVCDMLVDIATARFVSEHEGQTYYFCCPACKKKFEAEPSKYLTPATA